MTPEQISKLQDLYNKLSSIQGLIEFSSNALKAVQEVENDPTAKLRSWELRFETDEEARHSFGIYHHNLKYKQKEIIEFIKNLLNKTIEESQKELEELKNDI